ncbi:hypothetical protein QFZ49_007213 [Streptomyces turgidiscabies]|uniref:ATP-binding protein n=1 Tax=Streptomyces turgidiscabies TaxID=85558 RepID=A0ABU0RZ34_9ACTN|nr:hypothetical protein [Streptomyces turgidiscabies]
MYELCANDRKGKPVVIKLMGWAHPFPTSGGVRAGRHWARRQLESLPWTVDEPETVDAVVLTVSELLTNAHVHAHSDAITAPPTVERKPPTG